MTVESHPKDDPIVLLKHFIATNKKVRYQDDCLDFEGQRFHRGTRCGYRIAAGTPRLDIGSIWYMFREISGDRPYTQDTARKRGFQYIGVANRGDLLDYLVGRADTCSGLQVSRKRPRDADEPGGPWTEAPWTEDQPPPTDQQASAAARAKQKPLKAARAEDGKKAGDISYEDVVARVRPVKDLDVLVRAPGQAIPNAELILRIAQEEVDNWNLRVQKKLDVPKPTNISVLSELEKLHSQDKSKNPIILVPCNKRAPVNLLTVQNLLQDGRYEAVPEDDYRFFESVRKAVVEIKRNVRGPSGLHEWTFEARDSTKDFTKAEWLRVVAVISDGSDWQFKGWPFESTRDLFATAKGFYFCPRGTLPAQHIHEWAVHILYMPQQEFQHKFAHIRDTFWTEVEAFLRSHRQKKFVNHTTLDEKTPFKKTLNIL